MNSSNYTSTSSLYNATTTLTVTNANVTYLVDKSALFWVVNVSVIGQNATNYSYSATSNTNTTFDFFGAFESMAIWLYLVLKN